MSERRLAHRDRILFVVDAGQSRDIGIDVVRKLLVANLCVPHVSPVMVRDMSTGRTRGKPYSTELYVTLEMWSGKYTASRRAIAAPALGVSFAV